MGHFLCQNFAFFRIPYVREKCKHFHFNLFYEEMHIFQEIINGQNSKCENFGGNKIGKMLKDRNIEEKLLIMI